MPRLIYAMNVSLDGYIADHDGRLDWAGDGRDLFRFVTDETRALSAYIMGRRLYETMLYWEDADRHQELEDDHRAWAAVWKPLPKLVFSTTLTAVEGNARLATGTLAEEVERLRAEPVDGGGDIAIGGATLAAEAARLGLIDEYRPRVHPVLIGGGTPFFPSSERRVDLELIDSRSFPSQAVASRYRVAPSLSSR
jgi:dihydrofolate reductase